MDEDITNIQKYENYKEQSKRLKKALNSNFYLEAIFIEYAIIEDRTQSILKHAGKWDSYLKNRRGYNVTLDSKIKYIKKIAEEKKSVAHRYFSDSLLDDISAWMCERNRIIHALLNQSFKHNELHELAEQGDELVRELKSKSTKYNHIMDKQD